MRTPTILKRRKHGLTDYRRRYRLVKSGIPRLVVRLSAKGMTVQLVEYDPSGDRVRLSLTQASLPKVGVDIKGNSTPSAYLLGYLAGLKAKKLQVEKAILDIGRFQLTQGGRISAAVKGFVDAGCDLPHEESIFPSDSRINGEHLKAKLGKKFITDSKKKMESAI